MFAAAVLCAILITGCPLFPGTASAAGTDITKTCTVTLSDGKSAASLTDGLGYKGFTASGTGTSVTITPPSGTAVTGLWLSWLTPPGAYTIENAGGTIVHSQSNEECYIEFVDIPQTAQSGALTLRSAGVLALGEVRVFSGPPDEKVKTFVPPAEQCDILIIAAHPDDDVLYFGPIVPAYAVNRGYKVQVVILTPCSRRRIEECMYGQWMLGNRFTPVFGPFKDVYSESLAVGERAWGAEAVSEYIVEQIRRFKPSVVIAHDLEGEYGHGAHMVAAKHTLLCVKSSADANFHPASAGLHGVWTVAKCYLHLYKQNAVVMNWNMPVPSMGGKTALAIARTAFLEHVTQAPFNMDVRTGGKTSVLHFGLAYTRIGNDVAKNDFMENVTQEAVAALNPAFYATPTPAPTPTPTVTPAGDKPASKSDVSGLAVLALPLTAAALIAVAAVLYAYKRRSRR
jgi:LmbE family N-acetylglucosaminyl deacetylase